MSSVGGIGKRTCFDLLFFLCLSFKDHTVGIVFERLGKVFSAPSEKALNADFQSGKRDSQLIID